MFVLVLEVQIHVHTQEAVCHTEGQIPPLAEVSLFILCITCFPITVASDLPASWFYYEKKKKTELYCVLVMCESLHSGILAGGHRSEVKGRSSHQVRSSGCHGDPMASGYWGEPAQPVQRVGREVEEALDWGRAVGQAATVCPSRAWEIPGMYKFFERVRELVHDLYAHLPWIRWCKIQYCIATILYKEH